MKGLVEGREYELTGRVVFSWEEGGEQGTWQEFELVDPDGDVLFLEFEDGKWLLMESFVPTNPIGPQDAAGLQEGSLINLDDSRCVVSDRGTARVSFVEGELTYTASIGREIGYLDAQWLSRRYAVEWTEDEVEFYRGKPLSDRQVLVAFGLRDQLAALDAVDRRRRQRQVFANFWLLLSLICFVLWGISAASGRLVASGSAPIEQITDDGVRFGPLHLKPDMHVHRMVIHGQMSEASVWVAGVLEAADGTELIGSQRDFWDESGYDSDGAWHESDLRAHTDFVVKKPGPYYVRLYAERDPSRGSFGNAGYELYGGILYPTYLAIYGFVALVVAIVFHCVASSASFIKMAESSD